MQYAPIHTPLPVRLGPWVRKRRNDALRRIATAPLTALHGTPADPWSVVNGKLTHTPNPTWLAAVVEYNRRIDLYERLVPLAEWGI